MRTPSSPRQTQRQRHAPDSTPAGGIWKVIDFDGKSHVFTTDLSFLYFFYLEGDQELVSITHELLPTLVSACPGLTLNYKAAALAEMVDGTKQLQLLTNGKNTESDPDKSEVSLLSEVVGGTVRCIKSAEVVRHTVRTQNWIRLLSLWNRCNQLPVVLVIDTVVRLVQRARRLQVSQVFLALEGTDRALIAAAIAISLRRRRLNSDLDDHHWGLHSILEAPSHE